jgi:mono/diheme cytochrome c family protein
MIEKNAALALVAVVAAGVVTGCGREEGVEAESEAVVLSEEPFAPTAADVAISEPPAPIAAETIEMNSRRGRILFIAKGCVICHQVNGVGGKAAPDLSTTAAGVAINPLDFSARMWRGASAMTALQAAELGYVIDLDAEDIADLAAFAGGADEQGLLTLDQVGVEMRKWFLDEPYWRAGDWSAVRVRGEKIPTVVVEDR